MNYKQIISHKHLFTALVVLSSLTASAQQMAGGDVSMLPKYEAANVKYYTQNGTTISNVLTHLHDEAGFSIIRLRLFVNPTGETGVVQDLDYVKTLGQRVKAAGMKLMLDFHYSDTWADPSHQDLSHRVGGRWRTARLHPDGQRNQLRNAMGTEGHLVAEEMLYEQ